MRNAIIVPICISPAPMRFPPNQIAATLDTFSTSMTLGNMNAMSRPARSDELVSDWFAMSKRRLLRAPARTLAPLECR